MTLCEGNSHHQWSYLELTKYMPYPGLALRLQTGHRGKPCMYISDSQHGAIMRPIILSKIMKIDMPHGRAMACLFSLFFRENGWFLNATMLHIWFTLGPVFKMLQPECGQQICFGSRSCWSHTNKAYLRRHRSQLSPDYVYLGNACIFSCLVKLIPCSSWLKIIFNQRTTKHHMTNKFIISTNQKLLIVT